VSTRFAATGLFALIAVLAGAVAVRHPVRWDASAARRNSLDPITVGVLASLPRPATLTIVEPTLAALGPIYAEVRRIADRMAEQGPIRVRSVDPASLPGGLEAAARIAGVAPADLASNGGVVVELGDKRRVIDRVQLVSIARDEAGAAAVERLAIEQSIAGALAQLTSAVPVRACATTGHQELSLSTAADDADWSLLAQRLAGDGIEVTTENLLDDGISSECNVLILAGPTVPLSAEEALVVQAYLKSGGSLLVAAASRPVTAGASGTTLAPTGLEAVLGAVGLGLPPAIAVDPALSVREIQGALLMIEGYAAHPINEGFARTRPTIWFQPRIVLVEGSATPLVTATATSWGERNLLVGPPQQDPDDVGGPVALAALGAGGHVIAIGSAESFTTAVLRGSASAGDLWLTQAVRFLAGKPSPKVSIPPRSIDQVRLVMSESQRRSVVVLSVAGIPLAWILVGALVLVMRRRRA
jgi:hypothetical protein